jgi:hypothetical protein
MVSTDQLLGILLFDADGLDFSSIFDFEPI